MLIRFKKVGDSLVCTVEGDIIAVESVRLRAEFQAHCSHDAMISVIVLDLRRVTKVDSTGIGVLTAIYTDSTRLSLRKPIALIIEPESAQAMLLRLTHVSALFKVLTTDLEAFHYLRG
jgi:anti-anti-sigma factor